METESGGGRFSGVTALGDLCLQPQGVGGWRGAGLGSCQRMQKMCHQVGSRGAGGDSGKRGKVEGQRIGAPRKKRGQEAP